MCLQKRVTRRPFQKRIDVPALPCCLLLSAVHRVNRETKNKIKIKQFAIYDLYVVHPCSVLFAFLNSFGAVKFALFFPFDCMPVCLDDAYCRPPCVFFALSLCFPCLSPSDPSPRRLRLRLRRLGLSVSRRVPFAGAGLPDAFRSRKLWMVTIVLMGVISLTGAGLIRGAKELGRGEEGWSHDLHGSLDMTDVTAAGGHIHLDRPGSK